MDCRNITVEARAEDPMIFGRLLEEDKGRQSKLPHACLQTLVGTVGSKAEICGTVASGSFHINN